MYIVMKNVNNLVMGQEGTCYEMELSRIFDGENPTDNFIIKYHDAESEVCEKCGEPMSDNHSCGEPAIMSEAEVESVILKEFNEADPGRILIINRGEFEEPDDGIVVRKK